MHIFIQSFIVKVNFWDVAGDPVYLEVRNEFYKDTTVVSLWMEANSVRLLLTTRTGIHCL